MPRSTRDTGLRQDDAASHSRVFDRQLAIHLLQRLLFLDSKKVTPSERLEASKRAQFVAFVIKPSEEQV